MGSKGEQYVTLDLNDDCFSSDHFRMYEFKVKRCPQARPHDWTRCPFAHPGEKAKRRDPLKFQYSGAACPEFRKSGCCRRGDACPFAHGVFECWCHPSRYRTQICTDGTNCKRRVCFFAHLESEVRKRDDLPMPPNGSLHIEPAAEVQQQMEVAQAYQVLLNASAHNPGGLANFDALRDFGAMRQHVSAGLPPSALAEHNAHLQHQLQQLHALQNIQLAPPMLPLPQQSRMSMDLDMTHDRVTAAQEAPMQGSQQVQASPFAQPASYMLPVDHDSGLGRDLSNLSLSMSLPNPNSMRPFTQVSPLNSAHTGTLDSYSRPIGSGSCGSGGMGPAMDRALSQLSGTRPSNASSSSPFQPDILGGLPPLPHRSESGPFGGGYGHSGDVGQFIAPGGFVRPSLSAVSPAGGNLLGLGVLPQMNRRLSEGFTPLVPTGFPVGLPLPISRPEQRHSLDVSVLSHQRVAVSPFGNEFDSSSGGGVRNQLHSLASAASGPLGIDAAPCSLSGGGVSNVGGRVAAHMERASSAGPGLNGFQFMDRSASGSFGARPPRNWQQQQSIQQQHMGSTAGAAASAAEALGLPLGSGISHSNRLGGISLSADHTVGPGETRVDVESSQSFIGALTAHSGVVTHAAVQKNADAVGKQGSMYHAMGRPPAIREDQQLVGDCFEILPPTQHQERLPPHIGRNTSFESILAELPRSLSEVGMNKGLSPNGAAASNLVNATDV